MLRHKRPRVSNLKTPSRVSSVHIPRPHANSDECRRSAKYTVTYQNGVPFIVDSELEGQAEETTYKYSNIFSTFGVLSALIAGLSMSAAAEVDAEGTIWSSAALRFYEMMIHMSFYLNLFVMLTNSALYMYCSRESHDMVIVEFFQQPFLLDDLDIFTLAIIVSISLCVFSVACLVTANGIYHMYKWNDYAVFYPYYSIVFGLTFTFFTLLCKFEMKWRLLQEDMMIQDPNTEKMGRSYWKGASSRDPHALQLDRKMSQSTLDRQNSFFNQHYGMKDNEENIAKAEDVSMEDVSGKDKKKKTRTVSMKDDCEFTNI